MISINSSHESSRLMKRRGLSAVMAPATAELRASMSFPVRAGPFVSYSRERYRLRMTVSWQFNNILFCNDFHWIAL